MSPTPISDTEPLWACDECYAEFDDRDEAVEHEATCDGGKVVGRG